ncbi:NAD(P)-binding protein [Thiocapsa roseopersicina]|uniref:NAD(P)-binding Rossmann-like domain-containing protein n=1 Tax=Thiocapsa roseopersicina TaxID=1058 RepID=A0A1H3BIG5_THIRO|nr:NAD(P)-binding protein [Thiocapsa roseopersicina]SDX41752.1 hypothetical protein SAMN05421783_12511 [Thiocapsa roseopersicina]
MMVKAERIAVIGSGMAGLACARRLTDAGCMQIVFDKGRWFDGQLATWRAPDGRKFDHGAQCITATSLLFQHC